MDSKVDQPFHIYTENEVDTLCGEKNDHSTIRAGYFHIISGKLFWFYGRGSVPVVDKNPMGIRNFGSFKMPMLEDDSMFIVVPGWKTRFHVCYMCEHCMGLLRLSQLDE